MWRSAVVSTSCQAETPTRWEDDGTLWQVYGLPTIRKAFTLQIDSNMNGALSPQDVTSNCHQVVSTPMHQNRVQFAQLCNLPVQLYASSTPLSCIITPANVSLTDPPHISDTHSFAPLWFVVNRQRFRLRSMDDCMLPWLIFDEQGRILA